MLVSEFLQAKVQLNRAQIRLADLERTEKISS